MTTQRPISEAICWTPRSRAIRNVAAIRPKIAPEAPTVSASGVSSRAPKAPPSSPTA
jgi:hypothetical protein